MIKKVTIQNFKSLQDVVVDLDPLTVLIGRSGSGKTNFVLALRFLRDYLNGGQRFLQELAPNRGSAPWRQILSATAKSDVPLRLTCEFEVEGMEGIYRYAVEISENGNSGPTLKSESLKLGDRFLYELGMGSSQPGKPRAKVEWKKKPALADIPLPSHESFPMIGSLPGLDEVVIAHVALSQGIGCYDFPGTVLKPSKNGSAPNQQPARGLGDHGDNHLSVMKDLVSNLNDLTIRKRITAALKQINPTVASVELNDVRKPTGAVVSHDFGNKAGGSLFN